MDYNTERLRLAEMKRFNVRKDIIETQRALVRSLRPNLNLED